MMGGSTASYSKKPINSDWTQLSQPQGSNRPEHPGKAATNRPMAADASHLPHSSMAGSGLLTSSRPLGGGGWRAGNMCGNTEKGPSREGPGKLDLHTMTLILTTCTKDPKQNNNFCRVTHRKVLMSLTGIRLTVQDLVWWLSWLNLPLDALGSHMCAGVSWQFHFPSSPLLLPWESSRGW